ncbi:MAG: hypothetical protein U0414_16800 [Polyangiaceae bacterium]
MAASRGREVAPRPSAPPREEVRSTFSWGPLGVTLLEGDDGRRVELSGALGARTLIEGDYVQRCELVELDHAPPEELWVATAAGAHGNREDAFFRSTANGVERWLLVRTDEGEVGVEDLDHDGRAEIVGTVSRYFEGAEFSRPLVLTLDRGRWRDATEDHPDRLRAAREDAQRPFGAPPRSGAPECVVPNAIDVLGVSLLLGEERAAVDWLDANCPGASTWLSANREKMRAFVREPVFTEGE